jgi:hypothetical protein
MSRVLVRRKSAASSACRSGGTAIPFTIEPTELFINANGQVPTNFDRRTTFISKPDSSGVDKLIPSSTVGPVKTEGMAHRTVWRGFLCRAARMSCDRFRVTPDALRLPVEFTAPAAREADLGGPDGSNSAGRSDQAAPAARERKARAVRP